MDPNALDKHNETSNFDLIGRRFRHGKRMTTYDVIGVCWIADSDEWGIMYTCPGEPVYVRSQRNFLGTLKGGRKRFEEVQ